MEPKDIARRAWNAATDRAMGASVNGLEAEFRRAAFELWWEKEVEKPADIPRTLEVVGEEHRDE